MVKSVTRKFLSNLADKIYNPKTRKHMNLCAGDLNGEECPLTGRTMHCGLGELYYEMNGVDSPPHVTEEDVVEEAFARSPLGKQAAKAQKVLEDLGAEVILDDSKFHAKLNEIPVQNDESDEYKDRARRVAKILREAAAMLP